MYVKAANTTKSNVNTSNVFIAISFPFQKRATEELSPYCLYWLNIVYHIMSGIAIRVNLYFRRKRLIISKSLDLRAIAVILRKSIVSVNGGIHPYFTTFIMSESRVEGIRCSIPCAPRIEIIVVSSNVSYVKLFFGCTLFVWKLTPYCMIQSI